MRQLSLTKAECNRPEGEQDETKYLHSPGRSLATHLAPRFQRGCGACKRAFGAGSPSVSNSGRREKQRAGPRQKGRCNLVASGEGMSFRFYGQKNCCAR